MLKFCKMVAIMSTLALLLLPVSALAHGGLVSSTVAADSAHQKSPTTIELGFAEEAAPTSKATVLNAKGEVVDLGSHVNRDEQVRKKVIVKLPESLPSGWYTVKWDYESLDDGATAAGEFSFVVLNPDGSTPARPSGMGTWVYISVAAVVVLGAGAYLFIRRGQRQAA